VTARFRSTLETLAAHEVEFIVVGGIAAVLQGAPIATFDLDLVHLRTVENVQHLLRALLELEGRYRGDPRGLTPTESLLMGPGHNLLTTTNGPLDLLGSIGGGFVYEDLAPDAVTLDLGRVRVGVLGLPRLIEIKEALGRPKDLAVLPALRATLEETRRRG